MLSAVGLSHALAGLALDVQRGRPTAEQWVEALALAAQAEPVPGRAREIEFTPGGAVRIHLRELRP
ncbi:hypothetical protein [Methylobacterium oxalidis]|uniref:Uncharacterized protein n=1 Tax=Methylobacterium oxalidis TaxID=944322 RepID=A0A512J265_9HYPH|nr:hypothetical protein [Methylobacterium oxalidis]GEP04045.1 hypothetical protein MOX02_20830 [Methylobacterium oxalidis]GJE34830.1 hypothetical protein LDDCCGHA_5045 [Methylobacterium oxalidis]GLS64076.1 hypothetical protein GCM10007888_24570 [Methylobacterium oxalidis]